MEGVRQLVQEEGREARNVVAFHVAVDPPGKILRKPPRAGSSISRAGPSLASARHRSASAGRDKRTELRARYWALLFGDLQRAVGEIYNTVETHENLSECQEVILVLENYTRDFKALGEWFQLKWEYDNTPPLQRPQSLAWEIRKTDFVAPGPKKCQSTRSSPSVSGKNSPSLSGYNTPTGKNSPSFLSGKISPGSGKISPRVFSQPITSPKGNVEFFSNKISGKVTAIPEPKLIKETSRLSDITERNSVEENCNEISKEVKIVKPCKEKDELINKNEITIELGTAKQSQTESPKPVVTQTTNKTKKQAIKVDKKMKQKTINRNIETATEEKSIRKLEKDKSNKSQTPLKENHINENPDVNKALSIIEKLDQMENEFLTQQVIVNVAKNENMLNSDKLSYIHLEDKLPLRNHKENDLEETLSVKGENIVAVNKIDKEPDKEIFIVQEKSKNSSISKTIDQKDDLEQETKKTELKTLSIVQNENNILEHETKRPESKSLPIFHKTAYSQAAAKPKSVVTKLDIKPKTVTTTLTRNKTTSDLKNTNQKMVKPFSKRSQASKCSYPFNLTTGRTLFDNNNKFINTRKIPIRNTPSSGDQVNLNKIPPKRPVSLRIDGKGDNESKSNTQLEKIRDIDEYGSSDTVITQIDKSRIESNESLKTLVPDDMQLRDDVASSIEVLNLNSDNDNEGWLTVKSRRLSRESKKQSKSHWANRFNQPSATTSLPTLNMIESPKQDNITILNSPNFNKLDRAKSEQPQILKPVEMNLEIKLQKEEKKSIEEVKKSERPPKHEQSNASILRQKSDITGLKTKSSRNKIVSKRIGKIKNSPTSDEDNGEIKRLHSSLESLTSLSHEIAEESFDFDKWKEEFKNSLKYLQDEEHISSDNDNEILKSADPIEMSEIEEMTSQIEENERKISLALDFQSDVDQKKLCEEEDSLNRQILELQQVSDVDLDTETDDTETDAEILTEEPIMLPNNPPESLGPLATSLEDQYEPALAGLSWAERVDTLATLEALVARYPGRAQTIHAKLSQGIRRRGSLQETLKRYQAKQARAEQQRLELQSERSKKIQQLLARVEEVKVAKNQLVEERRLRMDRRLQKAAQNRNRHLKDIVRKAHDEEEKLREIAFIKQLEAEHRRHDFLEQCSSHTTRLRELRRDRLQKLEQKAQRDAAVGARRMALEAARRAHVETLLEKRKERDARCEERKELLKQERDDAAREKAEGVKSRLEALAAAAELEADALRCRIQCKQDATQRRLASHLQAIRSKATSRVQINADGVDVSKESLPEEAETAEDKIKDAKALKKKCRKLKQKLISESITNPIDDTTLPLKQQPFKIMKLMTQLSNLVLPFIQLAANAEDEEKSKNNESTETTDSKIYKNKIDEVKVNNSINDNKEITEPNINNTPTKKSKNKTKNNKIKELVVNGINDKTEITESQIEAQTNEKSKNNKINDKPIENGIPDNIEMLEAAPPATKAKNKKKNKKNKEALNNLINGDVKDDGKQTIEKVNGISEVSNENNKKPKNKHKKQNAGNVDEDTKNKKDEPDNVGEKSSKKKDNNNNLLDIASVEKILTDIYRHIEKLDNNILQPSPDLWMIEKLRGAELFGYLLSTSAEPQLYTNKLSHKSLTTLTLIVSRTWSRSSTSAAILLGSRLAPHLATLLAKHVEQDATSNKHNHLPVVIADCLSVGFDAILNRTKYDDGMQALESKLWENDEEYVRNARARAHLLISYLCYNGAIAKTEFASEMTKASMHTLITICSELCLPSPYDTATYRILAQKAIKSSVGPNLAGARTVFCALFAGGAAVADAGGGFIRAARTTRLLRTLAELDRSIIQEAFGSGSWLLEFCASVSRLLAEHAPTDREAVRKNLYGSQRLDESLSETLVLDLIVLIGYFVLDHQIDQDIICEGWSSIRTLCNLPAAWIVSSPHNHILLPTLIALKSHPSAAEVINRELNSEMLEDYIKHVEVNAFSNKLITLIRESREMNTTT